MDRRPRNPSFWTLALSHADQAGGLAFLGTAHSSLGIFAFALSCILSAETTFLVIFQQVDIATFRFPYFAILVIVELIVFGPLLMFSPILIRSRLTWLHDYSLLVARYNRAFHEKWVMGNLSVDDPKEQNEIEDQLDASEPPDLDDPIKQEQFRREYFRQLRLRSCPGCGETDLF